MVFQNYALYPHMNARDNMAFGLRQQGVGNVEIEQRVRDAAGMLELTPLLGRKPRELSGGERQRVAIARVLVRERPVLLLDEPFASLGPALRQDMLDLVATLQAERAMTVLFVTHQPEDARRIAEAVVFLENGSVAATGPAAVFFSGSGPEAFQRYIGSEMAGGRSRDIARKQT
jgi:thiamine transport system ATP-binding protein